MASRTSQRRGAVARTVGFSLWMLFVALFLLWQATSYRGIMSLVGEWQFDVIGRHYPTFNYAVLVFLLCLPGYLLFLRPRKRVDSERPEAAIFRSARTMLRAMIAAAIGLAVAALVTLVVMLMLPGTAGETQLIDLSKPVPAVLAQGPATLRGQIVYERTAGFDEDMLLVRRNFRFAPVVGPQQPPETLRFFVQLPPVTDQTRSGPLAMTGVLKRNGLPGEIIRLFRYAGYQIDDPYYVLYLDPAAMRWPYWTLIAQFVIGAVLALLFGLVQQRRVKVIDRQVNRRAPETLPST